MATAPTPQTPPQPSTTTKRFLTHSGRSFELSTKSLFKNPNNDTKKKLITVVITLFADIVLPVVLYFVLKMWIDPVWALLSAAGPAFLSVVVKLAWKRQIDLIGLLVFFAFGITGVVAITTHDARILLMEKSIVTAILGFVFWLTLIPFPIPRIKRKKSKNTPHIDPEEVVPTKQPEPEKNRLRPFLFYAFKQMIPLGKMDIRITGYEVGRYEWFWQSLPSFKKHVRILTGMWGFGLLAEFGGRLAMVLSGLSTDNVVLYAIILGVLLIISAVYGVHARKGLLMEIDSFLAARGVEIHESGAITKLQLETVDQQGNSAKEYAELDGVQVVGDTGPPTAFDNLAVTSEYSAKQVSEDPLPRTAFENLENSQNSGVNSTNSTNSTNLGAPGGNTEAQETSSNGNSSDENALPSAQ